MAKLDPPNLFPVAKQELFQTEFTNAECTYAEVTSFLRNRCIRLPHLQQVLCILYLVLCTSDVNYTVGSSRL
jgi:hypothetical protein